MIEVETLVKSFGAIRAVDGVSLTVGRGEVLGFLGPNGAGKSTTMKMLTGFLTPSEGRARICGFDVATAGLAAKRSFGYLPEGAPAYPDMTAGGFLDFIADMRGLMGSLRRERLEHVIARCHISEVLHRPIEALSKGFKRRVGLAQAILHDPEVLILDEPTDGLDPNQKHEVRSLIREMAPTKAIIVSTHILEEVEAVCSRAIIIARGRIVADGTPAALAARADYHNAVTLVVDAGREGAARAALLGKPRIARVETVASDGAAARLRVYPEAGASILGTVGDLLRDAAIPVSEMRPETGRLEDVFRTVTRGDTN